MFIDSIEFVTLMIFVMSAKLKDNDVGVSKHVGILTVYKLMFTNIHNIYMYIIYVCVCVLCISLSVK